MELFEPGAQYGNNYELMIWVCTNPEPRQFKKCDTEDASRLVQSLRAEVASLGLHQRILICKSGCMLGCEPNGTTVTAAFKNQTALPNQSLLSWNNVKSNDAKNLLQGLIELGKF